MRNAIIQAVRRRIMRAWMASRMDALAAVPKPSGSLSVRTPGEDPARLLLVGGCVLVGHGVLSADLALQGNIARQVAASVGRGVDAQVIAAMDYTTASARDEFATMEPGRFDVVVLMLGSIEAMLQVRPSLWAGQVESILATLDTLGMSVIVSTIPGFSSRDGAKSSLPRRIADRHADRLNGLLRHVVGVSRNATLVDFDASFAADGDRFRSADTFARWARKFSPVIVDALAGRETASAIVGKTDAARL